ncbi:MAG: tetratricopeptide repeat protein [Acidobacteria bacterium]|nr:tetratricopeptide repeat protein [Acidobacteriota bacterium]
MLVFVVSCGGSKDQHLARGEEYLQKRKFHEALMEFRTAADIDRDSAAAHWGLARAYENLGQFSETVEALRKTNELAPDNLAAKVKLGNYYLLVQPPMVGETEKILEEVFAKDPNFIEGRILKASVFAVQMKPETEVLKVLDDAIALDEKRTDSYISKARYFMKIEKAKESEETIKKAISANPNAAAGYVEYGRFLDFADRSNESEAQFRKAIEVEPKNIESREAIADFFTSEKQYDKAEQIHRELVELQENSPESRLAFAEFYSRIGRGDEAVKLLSAIIGETPEYVRARYRLAEIFLDRRESEKVSEQIVELMKINDKDTEALLLKSRLALAENRAEEAVKDLEQVLKTLPSHKDALFNMVEARLAMGQTEQARAFIGDLEKYHPNYLRTRLLKIQAAFADGDAAGAFRIANELVQAAGGTIAANSAMAGEISELRFRALSARGLANLELGKLADAKADLSEVQKNAPRSAPALINLAKVAAAEKNLDESLSLYEKASALDARNFDALSGALGVLSRQKRYADAHGKIDAAIAANGDKPETAAFHYLKADIFLTEKNVAAAEVSLKRSIELDAEYLPAYSTYASILVERDQTAEAIDQYRKVIEKKASPAIYTLIGMLEESRENFADAEKNYRKALELAPGTPIAANNLAWIIADRGQGNLDEALKLSQAVVNKYSNTAGYYDTLGWVYFKKGLYSPAVEQMKKAVALDESEAKRNGTEINSAFRIRLATALASAGDKASARREVEASLQNGKNLSAKEAQEAKSLLATL